MREATRIVRGTLTEAVPGAPLHAGPVFASPFHTPGDPAGAPYSYGRSHNPTWTHLEEAIAIIEGGDGIGVRTFASGIAAVMAVFGAVLRAGDTVVLQAGAYFVARQVLEELFKPMGVTVRVVGYAELEQADAVAGARLVWIESPSNPAMEIVDLREAVLAAHAGGALVAVDNTTATPLGQKPLGLGEGVAADFSVCSDSKAMCGHSDVMLGHVATRDAALSGTIDRYRTLAGSIPGPMEAWLALRSLPTLPLRLGRMSTNALRVAEFLGTRKEVRGVRYPGLSGHPGHKVAASQMAFFGPVLGFDLRSQEAAERFMTAAHLLTEATSFGGVTTTAERRARWGHDDVSPGYLRMSVGCEDADDLLADFGQALDQLR